MRTLLSLISAMYLLSGVLGSIDLSTYPLSTVLRQSNGEIYSLYWSFNVEKESIRFAVNVSTTGWVGLGLSPNGGMAGSDIVIGWVNSSGQAFLNDRNAPSVGRPPIDAQQDWFLDEGLEEGGYTILAFHRQWLTCDIQDQEIKAKTARVIFSWNEADPANDDSNEVMHHGATNRGSVSVNLLGGQQDTPPDPVDAQEVEITVTNVNLPNDDTTYWCSVFELATEIQQEKQYITKYTPVITEGNENIVHHILVYECDSLNRTHVGNSGKCGVSNMVSECLTGTLLAAWAVGGQGHPRYVWRTISMIPTCSLFGGSTEFVYPADVAYPIGGPGAPRYLVMQTHYDNPDRRSDIVDSSGLEFTYTSTPRTHEAGILQIGHIITKFMIIPPDVSNYNVFGDCSSECTSQYFPSSGINIFANLLHTHLAGGGVTLHHVRANEQCGFSEELAPIEQNLDYDFNYQQFNFLPKIINVQRGDLLRLECNFNTIGSEHVVLGGEATTDEMCLSFAVYYPRTNLSLCGSFPNTKNSNVFQPFRKEHLSTYLELQLVLSLRGSTSDFKAALNSITWSQDAVSSFQDSTTSGPILDVCVPDSAKSRDKYQRFERHNGLSEVECSYEAQDACNGFQPTDCCKRVPIDSGVNGFHGNFVLLAVFLMSVWFIC